MKPSPRLSVSYRAYFNCFGYERYGECLSRTSAPHSFERVGAGRKPEQGLKHSDQGLPGNMSLNRMWKRNHQDHPIGLSSNPLATPYRSVPHSRRFPPGVCGYSSNSLWKRHEIIPIVAQTAKLPFPPVIVYVVSENCLTDQNGGRLWVFLTDSWPELPPEPGRGPSSTDRVTTCVLSRH